jgi:hypothetical protein
MALMIAENYDATFRHQPEQNDIEMDGELHCLSCDEPIFPDMTDEVLDEALDGPIVAPVDCPECGAHLEFSIEPLSTENIGLGIKVFRT